MKVVYKIVLFFNLMLLLYSCNSENVSDCFQNSGKIIRQEIVVPDFNRITVFQNIELILKDGPIQKVELETGKFLRNDVTAEVIDGRLVLKNSNGCNFIRDYGLTKFYVTSPNIVEIRSSTGLDIKSNGILGYDSLSLISENFNNPEADSTSGLFDMEVESNTVSIVSNGLAFFKLKGTTDNFYIGFAAGDSRLSAKSLIAKNISINHRSSNDMLVNPKQSISGEIRGTGNVICYTKPSSVSVKELYKGKLIFK